MLDVKCKSANHHCYLHKLTISPLSVESPDGWLIFGPGAKCKRAKLLTKNNNYAAKLVPFQHFWQVQ